MKQDTSHLPAHKQQELTIITQIICDVVAPEMIILFGSYARGSWVEDKYDETRFRYQSDFDILVVVETRSESAQAKLEREIEDRLEQETALTTPISIILHDIEFVNRRLSKAQYFFTDIKKEGICLYDSGKFALKEPKELSGKERQRLAQEDFDYWFENALDCFDTFNFCIKEEKYNQAAFLLHQTTERLYTGILLVFTRYKPNSHDLMLLRKLTNTVHEAFANIFPLDTPEDKHLFKLLRKAYVDARYKRSYAITQEELLHLAQQVEALQILGKKLCLEKIADFAATTKLI
jgi:predicted nucleotidyltransferase/HEPN domain-containing protein